MNTPITIRKIFFISLFFLINTKNNPSDKLEETKTFNKKFIDPIKNLIQETEKELDKELARFEEIKNLLENERLAMAKKRDNISENKLKKEIKTNTREEIKIRNFREKFQGCASNFLDNLKDSPNDEKTIVGLCLEKVNKEFKS
jgi:hypothetical protein